jgi:hypothetical protein
MPTFLLRGQPGLRDSREWKMSELPHEIVSGRLVLARCLPVEQALAILEQDVTGNPYSMSEV